MNTSSVSATLQATSVMNRGGGIVIGTISAHVENFVYERAPPQSLSTASLSRRCPQPRWPSLCATVHASQLRVGRPRRGSTSEIPKGSELGHTPGLRALVVAVWSHPVRPNYAFERTGLPSARARVRLGSTFAPSARLKCLRPAAQRER
jgi:hypothetical protein